MRAIVALGVHEHQAVAVLIEVLHAAVGHVGLVHTLAAPEGLLDDLAVAQVLELRSHEGAALAGLHVLEVHHVVGLAIDLDLEPVAKL
jgi:hypothetical protein